LKKRRGVRRSQMRKKGKYEKYNRKGREVREAKNSEEGKKKTAACSVPNPIR
jgi:hypothetical protein